jgi:hypothetical protein
LNPYAGAWRNSKVEVKKAIEFIGSHPIEDERRQMMSPEELITLAMNYRQRNN